MPLRHFLTAPSIIEAVHWEKPDRKIDTKFRPPATPLIAVDPYFSIWSCEDNLTDDWPKHWSGVNHALSGLIRVDGKPHRFMGPAPANVPALRQVSLAVYPTRTIYTFHCREIELKVGFQTPAIPDDLEIFAWPLAYLQFSIHSRDGKPHEAAVYLDMSAEIAVDSDQQRVSWFRLQLADCDAVACGTADQRVLEKSGDNVRIDWGHLYLAAPKCAQAKLVVTRHDRARNAFVSGEPFPPDDDTAFPAIVANNCLRLSACIPFDIDAKRVDTRFLIAAYDDQYSLEYHERRLRPYWRRSGQTIADLLHAAISGSEEITRRCEQFDRGVVQDLHASGGAEYARLACLAFRQTTAAHKLAMDFDGTLLYFSKENFSNGCMGTVDVTYPSSPFFLLFNPALLQAQLDPVMAYARSPRWKFNFAPHDLGVYPKANGQVYGGGERSEEDQMPVEECGNMLIMATALTEAFGDTRFASENWDLLSAWATYLRERGFNPEKQLCTDDFAGKLAHNANLSIKTILAIGCYARLCGWMGFQREADDHRAAAEAMVLQWIKEADDGDHFKLSFDCPGTWSLKYNLFWDKALRLNLFPPEVVATEMAHYRRVQNRFGIPLDSRRAYSKSDWIAWWAALCDNVEDFRGFFVPLYQWSERTSNRVPLGDWYWTNSARQVTYYIWRNGRRIGFQARSVVGGFFAKLYMDRRLGEAGKADNSGKPADPIKAAETPPVAATPTAAAGDPANE